jgi:hypothetical protein
MPALTRGQKILLAVAVLIVALYVTGVATPQGSGSGVDPTQNGLVKMLGGWFGGPGEVHAGELSAPCLADGRLSIKDSCVLAVAASDKDLREVVLTSDRPAKLSTRAPNDDTVLEQELTAGEEVRVAVDSAGAEITLTCSECALKVGG